MFKAETKWLDESRTCRMQKKLLTVPPVIYSKAPYLVKFPLIIILYNGTMIYLRMLVKTNVNILQFSQTKIIVP